jgi:hypothetical protein
VPDPKINTSLNNTILQMWPSEDIPNIIRISSLKTGQQAVINQFTSNEGLGLGHFT